LLKLQMKHGKVLSYT